MQQASAESVLALGQMHGHRKGRHADRRFPFPRCQQRPPFYKILPCSHKDVGAGGGGSVGEAGKVVGGVETFRDLSLVEELRKELEGRAEVGDLVSRSPAMRRIFDILPQAAAGESTVNPIRKRFRIRARSSSSSVGPSRAMSARMST